MIIPEAYGGRFMKKYRVEIFDHKFEKYNGSRFQNQRLDNIGVNIENILNKYFETDIEDGSKLHKIIPKYNEDNELECYIVVFANDSEEDNITVKFLLQGIQEPQEYYFPSKDLNFMFICGRVSMNGVEYLIKKKVYNISDDGEDDGIQIECELL